MDDYGDSFDHNKDNYHTHKSHVTTENTQFLSGDNDTTIDHQKYHNNNNNNNNNCRIKKFSNIRHRSSSHRNSLATGSSGLLDNIVKSDRNVLFSSVRSLVLKQ